MITNISDLDLNGTYSYADYLQWQFEETIELIKGKVARMSPAPKRIHQKASLNFVPQMITFFKNHLCEIYFAPFDVRLPKNSNDSDKKILTVLQPDICVVCDLSKLDDNGCNGAPDLIIEITSKSTRQRDFQLKYSVYEEAGVFEYWIAEPIEKVIYQNFMIDGKYELVAILGEGEILKSRHFPGLEIPVSDVFRD
jgi:Uma2 family endonuclease